MKVTKFSNNNVNKLEKPKNIFKMKIEDLSKLNSEIRSKLTDKNKYKSYLKNGSDKSVTFYY